MGFAVKFAFWFAWWLLLAVVGLLVPNPLNFGSFHLLLPITGLALIAYGLILNAIAGRTLKKFGHFDIRRRIKKPEKLVTVGIYECMRHPAQFGSILFGLGIALLTTNIYSLLLAGWYAAMALYFILAIEERETLREFGSEYAKFMAERKPFSFSITCLKKGIKELREN